MQKKLKIIIAIVVVIAVAVIGIVVFSKLNKGITEKDLIGHWSLQGDTNAHYYIINLYEGGTGNEIGVNISINEVTDPITWELQENTLKIKSQYGSITEFNVNKDTITTADGKHTYKKTK